MGQVHRVALLAVAVAGGAVAAITVAAADSGDRARASLVLYRTQMAAGSAYGGYSYANHDGADLRNFAVSTERRRINLVRGINEVKIAGVPATIDTSTISLRSITDPAGTVVLEQRFLHDLASGDRLLSRARGHDIAIQTESGAITGKLLDYDREQITVRTKDARFPLRVIQRRAVSDMQLASTAKLVTSPTLAWKIRAAKAGPQEFELSYRAHGIRWSASYTAIYNPIKQEVDLAAYATLHNKTGADVRGADVHLVHRTLAIANYGYGAVATIDPDPSATHTFHLRRKVDARSGDSVQLDLFPPLTGRKAKTVLVYEAGTRVAHTGYPNTECYSYSVQPAKKTSDRYLEIDPGGVVTGGAFPPGKARVFRRTAKGPLELVSEENLVLDDAKIMRIKVGGATQLRGSRKQLDCRHNEQARELREKIELTVANKSKRAVVVVVREYMNRWPTWTIEAESERGARSGAAQEYRISLGPTATRTINYTVVYSW